MLHSLLHQRLGRYYIKELLGRGGMAAVYCATDTVLQRDVALKILYPQYSDDAAQIARFQREAVTAAALEHPQIVPIYDVGDHDGMAYIAMKLLSGRTFQERLQEAGAIDVAELLTVLEPVAAALDYAHSRGVIHRDIKPGNIFLSQSPDGQRVMLTDFGIAKQLDTPGLTTTGALIGTPDYMAPEQIAGRPIDARTDVYALGMLAFRALTGRRAFEGGTQDVLMGHLYSRPPLPSDLRPGLPPALDAVILQAIESDPARRYAGAGAFARALSQAAQSLAASTRVGALPGAPARPATDDVAPGRPTTDDRRSAQPPAAPVAVERAPAAVRRLPSGASNDGEPSVVHRPPSGASVTSAPARAADRTTVAQPTAQPRGGAAPWIVAVLFAAIAGGLAVALGFLILARNDASAGGAAPTAPPSAPSATGEPTLSPTPPASPTPAPSPSAEPAGGVATPEPSPTPEPPTPAPPTPAPPTPAPPTPAPPSATPTATPVPPSATPTATPAPSATPTPEPTLTPTVIACADGLLKGGFGRLYTSDPDVARSLGCPRGPEVAGQASIQFFERGTMYWWGQNSTELRDTIIVFSGLDGGAYTLYPKEAVDDLPMPTPVTQDPNEPQRGFGQVYFGVPGVREALGLWTSGELELKGGRSGVIQFFDNGLMLFTPEYRKPGAKSIFVLYNTDTFARFEDS